MAKQTTGRTGCRVKQMNRKQTAETIKKLSAKAKIIAKDKKFEGELNTEDVKHFAEVFSKLTKGGRPKTENPSKKTLAQRRWREKLKKVNEMQM